MADNGLDLLKKAGKNLLNTVNTVLPNNPINKLKNTYETLKRDTTPAVQKITGAVNNLNGNGTQEQSRFIGFNNPSQILKTGGQLATQTPKIDTNVYVDYTNKISQLPKSSSGKEKWSGKIQQAITLNNDQELLLNGLQKSIYESKGGLTYEDVNQWIQESNIKSRYPNFNAEDVISLQYEIAPILMQTGEYIDNNQIAQNYPNLYHKYDIDEIQARYKEYDGKLQKILDGVNKANTNVMSENGLKYVNFWKESEQLVNQIRQDYNVGPNVTDSEILTTIWKSNEYWNNRNKQMQKASDKLSPTDLKQLGTGQRSSLANYLTSLVSLFTPGNPITDTGLNQILNEANTYWQNNIQPKIDAGGVRDENGNLLPGQQAVSDILSIPGRALKGASRVSDNLTMLGNIDTNKSLGKNISEKAENLVKVSGGTIETAFNTVLAPVTAMFHGLSDTPVVGDVVDTAFAIVPELVDGVFSGRYALALKDAGIDPATTAFLTLGSLGGTAFVLSYQDVVDWYNKELDDQGREDLQNSIFVFLGNKIGKSDALRNAKLKSKAFFKTLGEAIGDALNSGKFAYDLEIMRRRKANGGNVYETRHTLGNGEEPNYGEPVTVEGGFREGETTFKDRYEATKEGIKAGTGKLRANLEPNSEYNARLEQRLNKITAENNKSKVTQGVKEEVNDLEKEVRSGVDKQLDQLEKRVETIRREETREIRESSDRSSIVEIAREKLTGLDEGTLGRIKNNPVAREMSGRLISDLEENPDLDINEYQTRYLEDTAGTVSEKIDNHLNKLHNEIGNLYNAIEKTNKPIDNSGLYREVVDAIKDKVRFDENGDAIFSNRISGSERSTILQLLKDIRDIDDIKKLIETKRYADDNISYGSALSEGEKVIWQIRDKINDLARQESPEYKKVDDMYSEEIKVLNEFKDGITTRKDGKIVLRDNIVSVLKNLLSPANRGKLRRIEKHIPRIRDFVEAVNLLKPTYNALRTGYQSRFVGGIAKGTGGMLLRMAGLTMGGLSGYLAGTLADIGISEAMQGLAKKALKEVLSKESPKARARSEEIIRKLIEGKELSEKERQYIENLREEIYEEAEKAKKTKAEKEAWENFKKGVKDDANQPKLEKKDNVKNDDRRIVTGNDKTIVSDGKGNNKRQGSVSEADKRTEENKNLGYDTGILSDESYNNLSPRDKAKYRAGRDLKDSQNKLDAGVKVLKNKENLTLEQLQQLGKEVGDLERKQIDYIRRGGKEIEGVRDSLDEAYKILEDNGVEVRYLEKGEEFNDLSLYNSFGGGFVGKHYVVDTMSPAIVKVQDGKMYILAKGNVEVSEKPVEKLVSQKSDELNTKNTQKSDEPVKPQSKTTITGTKTAVLDKTETSQKTAENIVKEAKLVEENKQLPATKTAVTGTKKTKGGTTIVDNFKKETKKYIPNSEEIEDEVGAWIDATLEEADIDGFVKGIAIIGSRSRGMDQDESDLDIVAEIEGNDLREDSLFDILNNEDYSLVYYKTDDGKYTLTRPKDYEGEGIKVDINPIIKDKTGTIEDYLIKENNYLGNKSTAYFEARGYYPGTEGWSIERDRKKNGVKGPVWDWLKANGFADIDIEGIDLDDIDIKKLSGILNRGRDFDIQYDKSFDLRIIDKNGKEREYLKGGENKLLWNIKNNIRTNKRYPNTDYGKQAVTGVKTKITSSENTATKINNIKSFDDLSNIFEFEKPGEKSDGYYVGTLNGVKTQVWEHGSTIFVKYGNDEGPAQARISKDESDHIDQLKELLSEINNDGEILETNRNNYNPVKKNEVTDEEDPNWFDVEEVKRLMKEDEENGNQAIKEIEKQAKKQGEAFDTAVKTYGRLISKGLERRDGISAYVGDINGWKTMVYKFKEDDYQVFMGRGQEEDKTGISTYKEAYLYKRPLKIDEVRDIVNAVITGFGDKTKLSWWQGKPTKQDDKGVYIATGVIDGVLQKQYIHYFMGDEGKPETATPTTSGQHENAIGLKKQKNSSRINVFSNIIKKIIDKYASNIANWQDYGDGKLGYIIKLGENYLPLEITYGLKDKRLIVRHYTPEGYDDPAMLFKVTNEGGLKAIGIKQAFMEQYYNQWGWSSLSDRDEMLHIRAVNLEDQYLGENTIDEDTGEVRESNKEPETASEITNTKNAVTQVKAPENKTKVTKNSAKKLLENIVEKRKDVEMYNFDDEDSEGGGRNSQRYLNFAKELNKVYKKVADEVGMELTSFNKGYYNPTAYFRDPDTDKYYYVSIGDTRDPDWWKSVLYRTAKSAKDSTGGSNNYTDLVDLGESLQKLQRIDNAQKNNITANNKNAITAKPATDEEITGRFRNLTAEDYKEMKQFEGKEEIYYNSDKDPNAVVYAFALEDVVEKLRYDNIHYDEYDNFEFDLNDPKALVDRKMFIKEYEFLKNVENGKITNIKDMLDHDYYIDNWEEYDEKHPDKFKPDWNIEMIIEAVQELMQGVFGKGTVFDPFATQAFNTFERLIKDKDKYLKDIDEKRETIKKLVDKYGKWREANGKTIDNTQKNNITASNKTALTSNRNSNETNLGTSERSIGQGNQLKEGERGLGVSNMQSVVQDKVRGVQTNDNSESNGREGGLGSSKGVSTNGVGLETGERRRGLLSVKEQREINNKSREILEKHNFSQTRDDYTKDELENTLFQYSGNGGVAKGGDENVFGSRFQYYTPDLASKALWRGMKKYLGNRKGKIIDSTYGMGDLLKTPYSEGWTIGGFEIDPVPGTIAKLKFPDGDFHIGKDKGDFQNRFINFRGDVAYERPKDGGFNADAIILNPPFGQRITIKHDKSIKSLEDYFVKETIQYDSKDENTIIGLLMPSRRLRAGTNPAKEWLKEHTTFLEAYRLPAGVFQYTDVGTDLIILRNIKGGNGDYFVDDNYFKENQDRVLGEEKERKGRFGMEKYIEGDLDVIETIWNDAENNPKRDNAVLDTIPPIEKKQAQISTFVPKETSVSNNKQPEKSKTAVTSGTKNSVTNKKSTSRKSGGRTTVSTGTKTDIGTYQLNSTDPEVLKYYDHTDTNGYVEKEYYNIDEVKRGENPNLNFIRDVNGTPQVQTNILYFGGDVYKKLRQLEEDYKDGYLEEKQYIKQRDGLRGVIPDTVKISDVNWSMFDNKLMEKETDVLNEYGTKGRTIKELFDDYLLDRRKVPDSYFSGTGTSRYAIRNFVILGQKIRADSVSKNDPERERKVAEAQAKKQLEIQEIKEWGGALFNQFLQKDLSEEMQKKIEDEYNETYRAYVKPDFMSMPFSIDNISSTFLGKPLHIKAVQNEGIAFLTAKNGGSLTFGVGIGKTMTAVVSIEKMIQSGKSKRPVIIVPAGTIEDWLSTYHDLFPLREVIYMGGLNAPDIKRLKKDLSGDTREWVKDGQVVLMTYSGLDSLQYKGDTKDKIVETFRDVMGSEKDTSATKKDTENEKLDSMTEKVSEKRVKTKELKMLDNELSEKYDEDVLREAYERLESGDKKDFIEYFVNRTSDVKLPESVRKDDAERLYDSKPIFVEDLGLDFIVVDEVHNFKNSFKKAKTSDGDSDQYAKIASGDPSIRAQQMFILSQYIARNLQNGAGTFSLSATPFTNQPVEIYNILALHAYNRLQEKGFVNLNSFFDMFAHFDTEYIGKSGKDVKYGQVMKKFNNLPELQRLLGEYMLYHGDSPDLVRPTERVRLVKLDPSPLQEQIQKALEKEQSELSGQSARTRGLAILNDMKQNAISPYITQYAIRRGIFPSSWQEFIENSPKLKFVLMATKALRQKNMDDGVFLYMSRGIDFHPMVKEAVEKYTEGLKYATKVGIISGDEAKKKVKIDGESVEKMILTAKEFREGIINFLIGGEQTKEGINLQTKGYVTFNVSLGWNVSETIQVNGRIVRQGNLRDHALVVYVLLKNSGDIFMYQKYSEKKARTDEIWSFAGRNLDLEEISYDEEKLALNTNPEVKAQIYIDIEKKNIDKKMQGISGRTGELSETIEALENIDSVLESYERQMETNKAKREELKEALKAIPEGNSARESIESDKERYDGYYKQAKSNYDKAVKTKERGFAVLEKYGVDSIEKAKDLIKSLQEELAKLVDEKNNFESKIPDIIERFREEQEEQNRNAKTMEQYVEDLKKDYDSLIKFEDIDDQREYLDIRKEIYKLKDDIIQGKAKLTGNGKNKLTS